MLTHSNILIIEGDSSSNHYLQQIISKKGYTPVSISCVEDAIRHIQSDEYLLVICNCSLDNQQGFKIFNELNGVLVEYGVSFFLALEIYEKEDLQLGLEMGIDNFIFYPLSETAIARKIGNIIARKQRFNVLKTRDFREYFKLSHYPMALIEKGNIYQFNNAFNKISNGSLLEGMDLNDLLDINQDKINRLNFYRFQNGLITFCKLSRVEFRVSGPLCSVDMVLFRGYYSTPDLYFVELFPTTAIDKITNGYSKFGEIVLEEKLLNRNVVNSFNLTEREKEVFKLSASGEPIKVIAEKLNLSPRTVERHRANIMQKTDSRSIIEAIANYQNGIQG